MENVIKEYLDQLAKQDDLFEKVYDSTKIQECCDYILEEAHKRATNKRKIGMTNDEVFGLAVHFFQEKLSCKNSNLKGTTKVIITKEKLTDEEIKALEELGKEEAEKEFKKIKQEQEEEKTRIKLSAKHKKLEELRKESDKKLEKQKNQDKKIKESGQLSLFDF